MKTTKTKILETALKLFNKKGCMNTSTRHIAEELNISVGNLYYHFKNKESIIIEIFLEYVEFMFKEMNNQNYEEKETFLLKSFLKKCVEADTKYKFIHKELNLLLNSFPKLQSVMLVEREKEIELIKKHTVHQIKNGYVKEMEEEEILFFVTNSWIVATQSHSFWELIAKDKKGNKNMGTLSLFYFIKPYLTQKSLEKLKELKIN